MILVVPGFSAILFDWRGTLVADPEDEWWIRRALLRLGRDASSQQIAEPAKGLARAADLDEVRNGWLSADCSADQHRAASLRYFALAGLDDDLADALYALDFDPDSHPFGLDVAAVLRALKAREVKTAVVSDIHLDLRPEFAAAGFEELIDSFVLSFEHGIQKPDPTMFEIALNELGARADQALMVGDRPGRDGAATNIGITTLLVPTLRNPAAGQLDLVFPLAQDGHH